MTHIFRTVLCKLTEFRSKNTVQSINIRIISDRRTNGIAIVALKLELPPAENYFFDYKSAQNLKPFSVCARLRGEFMDRTSFLRCQGSFNKSFPPNGSSKTVMASVERNVVTDGQNAQRLQ